MRRTHALGRAIVAAAILLAGCAAVHDGVLRELDHPLAGRLWDPSARRFTDMRDLLQRAAEAEMLLLGETHDNPVHHRLQRQVLEARLAAGARPVLAMEQFDRAQQTALDEAAAGRTDASSLLRGWDREQYRELIAAAAEAGLTILGGNLDRSSLRPVVREGFSSLPPGTIEGLALDVTWDAGRDALLAGLIQESHCNAITPQLRDGLVRAQRLRDATLADAVLSRSDRGVVYILGRGHARKDIGVPRYLELRRPGTRVLSVAFVEVGTGKTAPEAYESDGLDGRPSFDLLWFTPRAERPDPCLAFKK